MPVTRFDVTLRRPLGGGAAFGEAGPYEELKGRLHFAIDPTHEANRRITDVDRAPRNSAGRVEFASDVSILVPVDRSRASGRVMVDVVNRGNTVAVPNFNRATRPVFTPGADPNPSIDYGDGFLMRRGFVVISCGWQCDVPEIAGLYRLHAPEALHPDGRRLTGRVFSQVQSHTHAPHMLLSDRGHLPYAAADVNEPGAMLMVRDLADAEPEPIPRERWRFARVVDGRAVPDPRYIALDGGFEKGRLYQIVYTAIGAPVMGLAMAALRDAASWLKHGGAGEGNPAPDRLRWAYAYGRSQTGRLLRTMVYEDLNLDEAGREALDGIIANVAGAMRGEFNQRFGQHSKDRNHMMRHLFPFTDLPQTDAVTGLAGALHHRLDARGSRVKVFYTNSSSEYFRGDSSLIHTDPDGKRDVAHGPHTRVYLFAGTEHGLGIWPPTDIQAAAADPTGAVDHSQSLRGILDYGRLLRACLVNLDRWVTEGVEAPSSRHPRIDDGTAVPPAALRAVFDRIPGAHYPPHIPIIRRLDFGDPGAPTLPPRRGPAWGALVAAVDADGNERAGIMLPELSVPLATHTGWNPRHPDIGGAAQLLAFAGTTVPFARTRRERDAADDPRPSIEERYRSRDDYLARVRAAAVALARDRYLLDEDVELSVTIAARMWDHWMASATPAASAAG